MIDIVHTPFTCRASNVELLYGDARHPSRPADVRAAVVLLHGFKGFKDWGSNPYICEALARRGFYTIAFNFSHNGVEGHSDEFTRLDRFERNTYSREIEEGLSIVDAALSERLPSPELLAGRPLHILGHSRGGAIAALVAAREPRIRSVALWAPVSDLDRFTEAQKKRWRATGYFDTKNMRTGQMMRLGMGLLEDLEANRESLNVAQAVASLGRPLLIVHGEQDLSVRIEEGILLAESATVPPATFVPIAGTNHTFGAAHPFDGSNPVLDNVLVRTAEFFADHSTYDRTST